MNPPTSASGSASDSRKAAAGQNILVASALAVVVSLLCWFAVNQEGLSSLLLATGVVAAALLFATLSFRFLIIPVLIWLVFLLGFRNLLMLHTPGLPDLSPDRVLLVWIFSLFALKIVLGNRPRATWRSLDTLLVLHLLYLLGSILYHERTGFNSWTRAYLMGYAAYFVGKYVIDGRLRPIKAVFVTLLVLNLYYGIVSIAEYLKFHPLIWPKMVLNPAVYNQWPGRSHGIFLQPAVYGIIMGMLLSIQVYFVRSARNPIIRYLLYASLPVVMAGLYFTYTRGSWLAGIFGLLTVGIVGWQRYLPLVSRLAFVAFLLGALGLVNLQQDKHFVERMGTEHTITGRLNTMARAYRIFLDNPITGCGYFRYNIVKRDYQGTIELPVYGVIRRAQDIEASIHDMYLGTLAEEGLVGAGLQLAIYMQVFLLFRRKYLLRHQGDPFAVDMMPAMAGLMVGYLVGGFSIDYRFFESLLAPFYLIVGLIAGYQPEEQRTDAALASPPPLRVLDGTTLRAAELDHRT